MINKLYLLSRNLQDIQAKLIKTMTSGEMPGLRDLAWLRSVCAASLQYTGKSHDHNIASSEEEVDECEAEVKKPKSRKPRAQSMNHKLHRNPKQDEGYNDSTPEHQPSVILSASFWTQDDRDQKLLNI